MENNAFILGQKFTGQERKVVAGKIAEIVGGEAKYQGPPTFAFKAGDWTVDRSGVVLSPETVIGSVDSLKTVYDGLKAEGLNAEGDLIVTLSASGHTGITLCNLVNIILSKEKLLMKAFDRQNVMIPQGMAEHFNNARLETVEDYIEAYKTGIDEGKYTADDGLDLSSLPDAISFSFFNATFDIEEMSAYVMFATRLNEQAKTQRYASAKQKKADNAKYAFRCFLLRLGFIGVEYKTARKVLMSKLEGNGSWKNSAPAAK